VGDQKISPAIRAAGRTGRTQRLRCAFSLWLAKDPDKRSIERSASMAGRCQERPLWRGGVQIGVAPTSTREHAVDAIQLPVSLLDGLLTQPELFMQSKEILDQQGFPLSRARW
jgi:hypothetical protein